jgi:general secretion pathway protein G
MKMVAQPLTHRGFTLIEMVITVAIVGLLASVTVPMAEVSFQRSKEHDYRDALQQIRTAIDAYKEAYDDGRILDDGQQSIGAALKTGYPASLQVLVDGVIDARSPDKNQKIYFLRHIPRDPFATDDAVRAEATWGKRSYASSADEPQEGDDVFDIYTLTNGIGINGVPYRQW